jgi:DNA-binding FrmR family transcriptional regulator
LWYNMKRAPPHGGGAQAKVECMDQGTKSQVVNRLKSIEGHVRGIERMVDEDAYCIDVIKQTIAVRRALDRVSGLILKSHLETCVTTAIRGAEPQERERVIGELLDVYETASRL